MSASCRQQACTAATDGKPETVQSATLIVFGGDFDPAAVTRLLGWKPSKSWRKGARKTINIMGTRRVLESCYEESGWKLWLDDRARARPLSEQLLHWAALLEPKQAELRTVRAMGASLEINCCLITSTVANLVVPATLQAQFADWAVDLDITFYSHCDDCEAQAL